MHSKEIDAPVRLVVVHDSRLCREGIRQLCAGASDIRVVADVAVRETSVQTVLALQPDVVVIGTSAHWVDAVEVTMQIREACPATRILTIAHSEADPVIHHMRRAGAIGHISKDADPAALIEVIRAAARSQPIATPARAQGRFDAPLTEYHRLTMGEALVLGLIAQGDDNRAIAKRLKLSEQTVANRLRVVYEKLGVKNRTQAALFALRHGWVALDVE